MGIFSLILLSVVITLSALLGNKSKGNSDIDGKICTSKACINAGKLIKTI